MRSSRSRCSTSDSLTRLNVWPSPIFIVTRPGDRGVSGDEAIPLPRHRVEAEQMAQDHTVRAGVGEHGDPSFGLVHVPHGQRLLAAVDAALRTELGGSSTNALDEVARRLAADQPFPSGRRRPRPLLLVGLAGQLGRRAVPVRLADLLEPLFDRPRRRCALSTLVRRSVAGATSGEMTISSNASPVSAAATRSAWRRPRSVSGGSTTFKPSCTHSGSP